MFVDTIIESHCTPSAMSRRGSTQPLLESSEDEPHSPAEVALQSNLDKTLTLKKRPSWFGSIRNAGQKVALGAKALVDSFRPGQPEKENSEQE